MRMIRPEETKWFWDNVDESCKEFHYGGCMGNKNRFNTKHECLKQCRYKMFNPIAVPGYCGDERHGQWWYYFNSETGICEKFFYYGCGGNDNKFYSLHMCNKVCGERLSPQIACQLCDLRTSFCKAHNKFNYTCECRIGYEKNQYGECIDIDECRGYTAVCDRNAWCTNTIGSYRCECMASYRGDGSQCTFVGLGRSSLDCRDCSPNATCENGVCQCKIGYEGDGFNCTDVNECLRMPYLCDKRAECLNRDGSYICTCLPGYAGNGYNCTKTKNACLDKFDRGYEETCGGENWREHYYLDHQSRVCQQFWYDGCRGKSRNIFSDLETCEQMCESTGILTRAATTMLQILFCTSSLDFRLFYLISHFSLIASRSEVCWDKFDMNYKNQCLNGQWQERYYFDHSSLTCRSFWYDGCRSDSRNMFDDYLTCQWLCEAQPMYKSRSCLQDFDSHYKNQCNGGRWRQQYYFDKNIKRCISFWYDGCTGENDNIFQDEQSCLLTCENPARKNESNDICSTANPCRNNGTCVYVWKKNTYYCKCQNGYTGKNCTEKIDFDPCASNPCQNGATCTAKVQKGKASYECYCAPGFGGPQCDQIIGASPPEERYGSNVLLVSSGKAEWIQEMKERLGGRKNTSLTTAADEPYKNSETKKLEREQREKQNADEQRDGEDRDEMKKSETKRHQNDEVEEHKKQTLSNTTTLKRPLSSTSSMNFLFILIIFQLSFQIIQTTKN
ncbi:Kunitz/Bovine pancreatic trypsin inhibitor domain protein [Dictyocaulus viviparus]|uniref:Kunitz/Bovine pancreatic trypsin inhibitor domain protein n=1 Tax=Dictyocaulus viviparus TaxID=29172 RepID=A0A0D8Y9S5_DICVI|nr:Kunitz/Bovine pancreatic trypsin inhibitor domain protein [Dictyocaulus viviparus]